MAKISRYATMAQRLSVELKEEMKREFKYDEENPTAFQLPGGGSTILLQNYDNALEVVLQGSVRNMQMVFGDIKKRGLVRVVEPSDSVLAGTSIQHRGDIYAVRVYFKKTAFSRSPQEEVREGVEDRVYRAIKRSVVSPIVKSFIELGCDKGAFE